MLDCKFCEVDLGSSFSLRFHCIEASTSLAINAPIKVTGQGKAPGCFTIEDAVDICCSYYFGSGGKSLKAKLWNRPLMALFIDLVSTGARLATIDECLGHTTGCRTRVSSHHLTSLTFHLDKIKFDLSGAFRFNRFFLDFCCCAWCAPGTLESKAERESVLLVEGRKKINPQENTTWMFHH